MTTIHGRPSRSGEMRHAFALKPDPAAFHSCGGQSSSGREQKTTMSQPVPSSAQVLRVIMNPRSGRQRGPGPGVGMPSMPWSAGEAHPPLLLCTSVGATEGALRGDLAPIPLTQIGQSVLRWLRRLPSRIAASLYTPPVTAAALAAEATARQAMALLDDLPGLLVVTDARGHIRHLNRSAQEAFGYTPTEVDRTAHRTSVARSVNLASAQGCAEGWHDLRCGGCARFHLCGGRDRPGTSRQGCLARPDALAARRGVLCRRGA